MGIFSTNRHGKRQRPFLFMRRLENLSWRLWNRETFCCAPGEANATTQPTSISQRSSEGCYTADIPDLSSSIDSINEGAIESDYESASTSAPLTTTNPRVRRKDSGCNRNRGKERHIRPDDLEKMVITIQEKKDLEPLTVNPIIPAPQPNLSTATSSPQNSPASTATSVVCGFFPFQISPSYQSIPLISTLASGPKLALASTTRLAAPKKYAMFALAGSSQSDNDSFQQLSGPLEEDENSLRDSMQQNSHRSSLSDALQRPIQKKNWEDSTGESGKSSVDGKLSFPRVKSRRNVTSRRSLITTTLHQNDGTAALQSAASKSTPALQRSRTSSPQGPSDAPSPESEHSAPLTMTSRMRLAAVPSQSS
ncbi:hypothetical protein O988_06365 [Pseudogymnoascus sp. VKM F-3808]|nr:hypothetical protein O988_06365 [Pseudogymnoascus sp. VKM F-3808]